MIRIQKLTIHGWSTVGFNLEIHEALLKAKELSAQTSHSYRLVNDDLEMICFLRGGAMGLGSQDSDDQAPMVVGA